MLKTLRQFGLLTLVLLAMTATALAQPNDAATTQPAADRDGLLESGRLADAGRAGTPGGLEAWGQLLLALGVVVALVVLLRWILKRFGGVARKPAGPLSVLGTTTIGPRQQVTLVQVGRKVILIGSAPGGLARLGEFDAETVTADQRQGGEQ